MRDSIIYLTLGMTLANLVINPFILRSEINSLKSNIRILENNINTLKTNDQSQQYQLDILSEKYGQIQH